MKNWFPKTPTPQDRVEKIINDMFEYGVSVENLFEPADLLNDKNIPKVSILGFINAMFEIYFQV